MMTCRVSDTSVEVFFQKWHILGLKYFMGLKFSILNQLSPKVIDRLWVTTCDPRGRFMAMSYGSAMMTYRLSAERHIGSPLGATKKMCTFLTVENFATYFLKRSKLPKKQTFWNPEVLAKRASLNGWQSFFL